MLVETPLGALRAIGQGVVGAPCVLAIRPENVALAARASAPGANAVRGRVALTSYLGNTLRYDIETPCGIVLKVDIRDPWHHDPLPVGREVDATFPTSVTLAVADDVP
jgi:ABC-type Fe3+/spermidine/putrescine transport system ATPase subunit